MARKLIPVILFLMVLVFTAGCNEVVGYMPGE